MHSLFERVVAASGIAPILAKGVIMRSCIRAGVKDPERMSRTDLKQALPDIYRTLELYLTPDELDESFGIITRIAKSISIPPMFDLADPALDE